MLTEHPTQQIVGIGIENLHALNQVIDSLPLTKSLMNEAAQFWGAA